MKRSAGAGAMRERRESAPPRVSIIMPFLNPEPFLSEAVDSVLDQTLPDWELLMVDDGSTDGGRETATAYADRHADRILVLDSGSVRSGASAARNRGIRAARGEYIAFLDADDVYLPAKLERQVAILDAYPDAAMVYAATHYWHGWTGRPEDADRDWVWMDFGIEPDTVVEPPRLLAVQLRKRAAVPCMGSILVRRRTVEAVGGFEAAFHSLYTDQVFYAKFTANYPIYVASGCWDRYRRHEHSSVSIGKASGEVERARAAFLDWLDDYLREQRIDDGAVWDGLRVARQRSARHANGGSTVRSGANVVMKRLARRLLPDNLLRRLRRSRHGEAYVPPIGKIVMGDLRRLRPISEEWGFDRGRPIDRYYIEGFLERHAADIRGRVLEIADATYTRRFGGARVDRSEVMHPVEGNPVATIVADLTQADHVPSASFDCIICTQTLLVIYDVRAAIRSLHRLLAPGGVLLVTVPGVSHQISRGDMEQWGDFWRFTSRSAVDLFREVFPADGVHVEVHGNVLTAAAFLYGVAAEELTAAELDHVDPDYQVSIAVRARKPDTP